MENIERQEFSAKGSHLRLKIKEREDGEVVGGGQGLSRLTSEEKGERRVVHFGAALGASGIHTRLNTAWTTLRNSKTFQWA